jgi:hypothetical protein
MTIGLHTICYSPETIRTKDPAFSVYDVSAKPEADKREIAHMESFWRKGLHRGFTVSGLLSPKFNGKTGVDGKTFIGFIEDNPGYDVWFINPFPRQMYLSFNIWEQGEFWHGGLCDKTNRLLSEAGMAVDVKTLPRNRADTLLYSNFWAGTPEFWDSFMAFITPLTAVADRLDEMFSKANHYTAATYFPFIFERMFSTFLVLNPHVKAKPWPHSMDSMLADRSNEMEVLMVSEWATMIDRWDAEGVYDEDRRRIFRDMQKFSGLFMALKNQASQRIAELSRK